MVDTESNQSSGNRNISASQEDSREEREEERQRTGLFRWDDPENLMPSWSVPEGLIVPGPRQPDADTQPSGPGPQAAAAEPAASDSSWPGVAPPAGWFLHASQSPSVPRQESAPAQESQESRESLGDQPGQRSAPRAPDPAPLLTPAPFRVPVPQAPQTRLPRSRSRSRSLQPQPLPLPRPPVLGRAPVPCPRPRVSRTDPGRPR